jgi:hypothetical protein
MFTFKRFKTLGPDPLPEAKQTGRKFEFAYDDQNIFLDVIDPANVPGPYDKVYLPLAWAAFEIVEGAMAESRESSMWTKQSPEDMEPSLENMARALAELRTAIRHTEVYLAWHQFWRVRFPDQKQRKQYGKTLPLLERRIAESKSTIDRLMAMAKEQGKEIPAVQ